MDYKESLDFLYNSLPMFQRVGGAAYKAGLGTSIALAELFDNPHKAFRSIHVAGTNGKGSVSHLLASILQRAGYRVGLYTSPHLVDFRERIRVNGEMISQEAVTDFVGRYQSMGYDGSPSFFELTMVMAFDYFRLRQVDIAVIEVGLGGRLDSTNIITPILSVITNISFDHMQFLGDTLPLIAAEKAGIIKPHVPVVIGEDGAEITVGAIDLKCGNLSFTGDVNVKGDINTTSDATLNVGGKLVAENLEIGGVANLDEVEMESLYVTKYAEVALTLPADAKKAGEITVNGGTLTLNGGSLATIETNNDGKIVVAGNVTNTDTFTGAVSGTGKFINKKGATATFNVTTGAQTNSIIVENQAGATINIEMPNEYTSGWVDVFQLGAGSSNAGTINVKQGQLIATNMTQTVAAARIYVEEKGYLELGNSSLAAGWVVKNHKDAKVGNSGSTQVAFSVKKAADLNDAPASTTLFIDGDLKTPAAGISLSYNAYINADQTLAGNLSSAWNTWVNGDVTFSGEGAFNITGSATLTIDGNLTLGDKVKVSAANMTVDSYDNITCKDKKTQVSYTNIVK